MTATTEIHAPPANRLLGWDSIGFWVGNARAFSGFLTSSFGFGVTAYAGPETGIRDRASYVLDQGDIRFVISAPLDPDSVMARHVIAHGDGVHDLVWRVDDVDATYAAAVARGAHALRAPWNDADERGTVRTAQIATYGETVHTFIDRTAHRDPELPPGYTRESLPGTANPDTGLRTIDHVVGNVEQGRLDDWVRYYAEVLGFSPLVHFSDEQISTQFSALMSTVLWNGTSIVMPINEPAPGRRTSQIQEYLDAYRGPGVQHLALRTDDIVATVAALRARGVRFMRVPDTYYDEARTRLAGTALPWHDLQRLNILADRDETGYLLQIFTETITDRPTLFLEIIERRGARGFGEGNFKALFEAIEREQARRGSL